MGKTLKSANATTSRSEEFERNTVDNSHYTIIKPTIGSAGSAKINSLILKRVPSQTTDSEPPFTPPASKSFTQSAATKQATINKRNLVIKRHMSVRELKQLMMRECKNALDETEAARKRLAATGTDKRAPVVNIVLADSEENIDNEPRLNILSDGTKKLVISGKRRSFVENTEFRNGYPPARTIQCLSRTVYIVELATEATMVDVQSKVVKSPCRKMSNQSTAVQSSSSSTFSADLSRNHPPQEADTPVEKTDRLLCSLMNHINEMLRRTNLDISPGKK
uniref:Uncharacterized protein n=1 Tax=Anopheles maculatus TaxID=74869 RepID=A0A182T5M1_9DIPT